jgi:hypothetical protein
LRIESRVPVWKDGVTLESALRDSDTRAAVQSVASDVLLARASETGRTQYLSSPDSDAQTSTLGRWATEPHGSQP